MDSGQMGEQSMSLAEGHAARRTNFCFGDEAKLVRKLLPEVHESVVSDEASVPGAGD